MISVPSIIFNMHLNMNDVHMAPNELESSSEGIMGQDDWPIRN